MRKEELMEAPWKRTSFVRGKNKMHRENDVSSQSNLHDTPKRQRVSIAFIC